MYLLAFEGFGTKGLGEGGHSKNENAGAVTDGKGSNICTGWGAT
jgi:hypothetical protein